MAFNFESLNIIGILPIPEAFISNAVSYFINLLQGFKSVNKDLL